MLACTLHTRALQHISQPRPAETCCPNRTLLPLDSWDMRNGKRSAVPGAFQSVSDCVLLHFCQLGKREGQWFLHFSTYAEPPLAGVEGGGLVHVVAHKKMFHRCKEGARVFDWHFQI